MRHLGLGLLLALAAALPGSELSRRLDQAVAGVPDGGRAGIAVYDLASGTWAYLSGSNDPLALASTTKVLTTVSAYHHLGPDFQFQTRVVALGERRGDSLPGIGVIGGGDPCLDGHFYDDDPELAFRQWAEHLRKLGIARIDGDVVVDGRLFSGPIRPDTYPQDAENQQRWYSAPASAFAWNDNCIEVRALPTSPGHPGEVQVRPRSDRVEVRSLVRTTAKGEGRTAVAREADRNAVTVSGTVGKATAWFPVAIASDPDLLAGEQLRHALVRAGIAVSGQVRLGAVDPRAGELLVDLRHELQPALTLMNQHSQNFYAEQLLRLAAARRFGEGTIGAGRRAALEALGALLGGKDLDGVEVLDGSGLSYGNRASASFMTKVLVAMHRTPLAEAFVATLKTKDAGGTRGYVKTGTLAIACCLVGYIDLPERRRVAFAILLNRGEARKWDWAPKLRDNAFKIIAESAGKK